MFRKSLIYIILSALVFSSPAAFAAPGDTTAPYTISYSGRLTSGGLPVITAQNIRFSIWSDDDIDFGDFTVPGGINTSSPGYANWYEEQTVTPDANGLFHLRLGTINTLPNFTDSVHKFLQVEVKPIASPATDYEALDPDGNIMNINDRHPLNSSAFTINSDTVDNRDVGNNAGQIPFLDMLSKLQISTIPNGTNENSFILDFDNTVASPNPITLQFGSALARTLSYDTLNGWFNFNDDVNIAGNLTITGTLNGVGVGSYSQSSVREAAYADSVYQGDGVDNEGKLEIFFQDVDGTPGNNNINHYKWSTTQATLQDFDLVTRVTVPENFISLSSTPITFTYKTQTAAPADNVVNVIIQDTNGANVTVIGGANLTSTNFTTAGITFAGGPVFTPGQQFTIKVKLASRGAGAAFAGRLTFNYNGR
ncbi:MAG: hypothetical protein ACRCZE_02365 [Candidatus Altimarinota bacterium]